LRKKRNEHTQLVKEIVTLEDEKQKDKLMEQHHKVGKSYKNDIAKAEKELEVLEQQLIVRI